MPVNGDYPSVKTLLIALVIKYRHGIALKSLQES